MPVSEHYLVDALQKELRLDLKSFRGHHFDLLEKVILLSVIGEAIENDPTHFVDPHDSHLVKILVVPRRRVNNALHDVE